MDTYHISVLLEEAVLALKIEPGKKYIDATLGGGGHTTRILEAGGKVLSLDVDEEALEFVKKNVILNDSEGSSKDSSAKPQNDNIRERLTLARGNFREIDILAKENGFEHVSGILFDLGVSSHQFDAAGRGFSIQEQGPLDMRMDQRLSVTAKDLINGLTKEELLELFTRLGEERFAWKIAGNIVESRKIKPIETTAELEGLIRRSVPRTGQGVHPATRVFQALRIAVNDELNSLREALPKAITLLEHGGRLVIISFHSLEDRIVKHTLLEYAEKGIGTIITNKPVMPGDEEIERNPRSRSAKMRVFEKR